MKILFGKKARQRSAEHCSAFLHPGDFPRERLLSILGVAADSDLLKALLQVIDGQIELACEDCCMMNVDDGQRQYRAGALASLRFMKGAIAQLVAEGEAQNRGGAAK